MKVFSKLYSYLFIGMCLIHTANFQADSIADIPNYLQYNNLFASSGQPNEIQLQLLADSGVQQIIYLAFTDNKTAIANEDRIVKSMGMDYAHIPVDFGKPTLEDFKAFAAIMEQPDKLNTLLHCQVNFRASTFSFLYRVIFLNMPVEKAKQALDKVWEPNKVWFNYLKDTLNHYSINYSCKNCDWGIHDFTDNN